MTERDLIEESIGFDEDDMSDEAELVEDNIQGLDH